MKKILPLTVLLIIFGINTAVAAPSQLPMPGVNVEVDNPSSLKILFLLTLLSLLPGILLTMTSFTRIIVTFSFLRSALGLQQTPPNQVLIGLAFFMTLFIMAPYFNEINDVAVKPYFDNKISIEQAIDKSMSPLKKFMLKETRKEDLIMFYNLSGGNGKIKNADEISNTVIIPAFITSELRAAFMIGAFIYLPFLAIDMIVAVVLSSVGMIMVPPMMISLPLKLLVFVLIDGWGLIRLDLVNGHISEILSPIQHNYYSFSYQNVTNH